MSWALLISRATAGLASNVCGSVFGLLMIAVTWTYLPPTCWMTLAYSFSAPVAAMVPPDTAAVWPDAADDDEHALASRAAASGRTAARAPERVRMACWLPGEGAAQRRGNEIEYRYDNRFH